MTQQTIIVAPANSGLGDPPYTAFSKINSNFNDLYGNGGSLPQATSLTGAELLIVSASGVPEYATVSQVAALAQPPQFGASSTSPSTLFGAGSFAGNLLWATFFPTLAGGGLLAGTTNTNSGAAAWSNLNGTYSAQQVNGAGTNLAASVGLGIQSTGVTNNSAAEASSTTFSPAGPAIPIMRATSNGLGIAGFTMTMYFVLTTVIAGESIFFGFCTSSSAFGGTQVPSALLNTLGLGKDTGDTNLSWYMNNGSGSATKTSLGVTPASLANQLLRLVITADPLGNCTMTLTNMESGGSTVGTISLPTATAKLPVTNQLLTPHLFIGNNSAANCAYGVQYLFVTAGFMA
jgi:hypothetical protein